MDGERVHRPPEPHQVSLIINGGKKKCDTIAEMWHQSDRPPEWVQPWMRMSICALFEGNPSERFWDITFGGKARDRRTDRWTDCRLKTVMPLGLSVTGGDAAAITLMEDSLHPKQVNFPHKYFNYEKLWWWWRWWCKLTGSSPNVCKWTYICKGFRLPNVAEFPRVTIHPSSFPSFCHLSLSLCPFSIFSF